MKSDILYPFTMCFLGFSFGIVAGSILTDSRRPSPKFHYKDKVTVIDGFFKGMDGVIVDTDTIHGRNAYLLRSDEFSKFVEEKDLQELK